MCDGGEATVLDLGSVERDGVFGEFEALLDEGCEFANPSALLAEDFLGMCCADDWYYKWSEKLETELHKGPAAGRVSSVLISVTVGVTLTSTPE